jgi:two-component system, cell cycle sensor histidine kinase and response regulator CckA
MTGPQREWCVWGIGVAPEHLDAIADLGADVVCSATSELASVSSRAALVLVVTVPARVAEVRAGPEALTSIPLLALVEDDGDAPAAILGGADYALAATAPRPHFEAVFLAARREAEARASKRPAPDGSSSDPRHRMLMESAGDAILIADFESAKFVDVNRAACEMFGYEEAEFRTLTGRGLGGPESAVTVDRVARALVETGAALEPRYPMRRKDGSSFWATVRLTTYQFLGRKHSMAIIRDVTEQVEREQELVLSNRQLEEAQQLLMHSSRLAALGQMAAGVAHEINNPLQFILSGFEALEPLVRRASTETRQALADMREGAERIRSVTRSLLPFARVDGEEPERVDLNELVAVAARMSANEIRHRARLELKLTAVPAIMGHRSRVGQLITNLLTNAAHAIDEGTSEEHCITVATEAGPHGVRLTVQDTGRGIPEELRSRIFDPFFTTKPRELGTGLGLALCAEIVSRYKGTIGCESEVGKGSIFTVTFPIDSVTPAETEEARPKVDQAGRGRVLVIDDEEAMLRAYHRLLRGYDVVAAVGGKAAIECLTVDSKFDAIVCDLMMPNADGPMVYSHIHASLPHLTERLLFSSGGAFTPRVRQFLAGVPNVVLDKPITSAQLREAIDSLMSRNSRERQ